MEELQFLHCVVGQKGDADENLSCFETICGCGFEELDCFSYAPSLITRAVREKEM